ncbi:MAG: proline--tRNA ligase [Candidatus Gracilibacteria bacterium]|nr:proline--tRNA ligase [Candidatus Gracilibacteria bacterium]
MYQSSLISKTTKEAPKDATAISHKLLTQAGFIFQTAAGIYSYLPLGWRVLKKIDQIIREEFEKRGVQDLLMPIIHPVKLWEETGRAEDWKDLIARFKSKRGQELIIAPTHEETVSDIARSFINSYKDLPIIVNQNQLKFRDETRVQGGILRTREFMMQDAYSFDADTDGLQKSYDIMREAYIAIFKRIGADVIIVAADSGAMGGSGSEEFILLTEVGEDKIVICKGCEYKANMEKADGIYTPFETDAEMKPMEKVYGEGIIGVEELAKFLDLPPELATKTILFQTEKGVVAAMIRGDFDINEAKLKNALGVIELNLASAQTIKDLTGAEVGYAGPVNLPESVRVIADFSTEGRTNFECGGNETDYHLINVNFDRDFPTPEFADIRSVQAGETCPSCKKGKLKIENGIEVGHIFQLGTKYSESMGIQYSAEDGSKTLVQMGCYGIGMTRLIASITEQIADDKGLVWPLGIAPFQVHLLGLNLDKDEEISMKAHDLYETLRKEGIEVLFDNRNISAGKKFADSDLIGIPLRLTLSKRSLENGGLEWKVRTEDEAKSVSEADIIAEIKSFLNA